MRRAVAFVLVAVALAGCFYDLSGFTSGEGSDLREGGDVETEGNVPPPPPGTDGGVDGDAALCSEIHDLCDDFERGPAGDPRIWSSVTSSFGTVSLTTDFAVSPSHAAVSIVPPVNASADSSSEINAGLVKDLAPGKRVTCDFEVRVDGADFGAVVFGLSMDSPGTVNGELFRLGVENDTSFLLYENWGLTDGGNGYAGEPLGSMPLHSFVHIRFVLDFDAHTATVTKGGIAYPPHPIQATGATTLRLGVGTQQSVSPGGHTGAMKFAFDDVVCDVIR